jgi:hypothetical protein
MKKTTNCTEVIGIDTEVARLDNLAELYQRKVEETATQKAELLARKSTLIQAGYCQPVAKDRKDPVNGRKVGVEYTHAASCQHKTAKLEV